MSVTRKDVAEKAEVSPATVSHVINNTKYVSDELKQRVNKAIEELNYKPNMVARNLSTNKTKQVVIVAEDITNPFFSEIILGFEKEAKKRGYFVNVCIGNDFLDQYFDDIFGRNIDGMYLTTVISKSRENIDAINKLLANDMVLATPYQEDEFKGITGVLQSDFEMGMDRAIKYLKQLGHKKIGFIDYFKKNENQGERYSAYIKCLEKYGLPFKDEYIVFGEYPYNSTNKEGYEYMQQLLKRDEDISAVIVSNDYMAAGALKASEDYNVRVPEDLSLVSFDNSIFSKITTPRLTTIDTNNETQGKEAMKLIDNLLSGKTKNEVVKIPVELVVRESTAPRKK